MTCVQGHGREKKGLTSQRQFYPKMGAQTSVLFFILFIFLPSVPFSLDNWIAPLTSRVAKLFKLT